MIEINKEEFLKHILEGKTIPELQKIYNCSRTTVTTYKKDFGFVGLSPNSKKIDRELGKKICSDCKVEKDLTEFYSNGKTPLGKVKYKPKCKTCENSCRKTHKYNLIEEYLASISKEYCCEKCGYSGIYGSLDFHHKNPDIKEFEIGSKAQVYSKERFELEMVPELEKCILLCPNCHRQEHLLMGSN